jgi:hypothetical protein
LFFVRLLSIPQLQLQEIARAVENSRFTVLVASSASRWDQLAQFAAELAQHAGLEQRAPRLVIVARPRRSRPPRTTRGGCS